MTLERILPFSFWNLKINIISNIDSWFYWSKATSHIRRVLFLLDILSKFILLFANFQRLICPTNIFFTFKPFDNINVKTNQLNSWACRLPQPSPQIQSLPRHQADHPSGTASNPTNMLSRQTTQRCSRIGNRSHQRKSKRTQSGSQATVPSLLPSGSFKEGKLSDWTEIVSKQLPTATLGREQ